MHGRISTKQIGLVEVVELHGDIQGPLSSQLQHRLREDQTDSGYQAVLFNATGMVKMDPTGASAIAHAASTVKKCAVLTRNSFTAEMLLNQSVPGLRIIGTEDDAVFYLGRELAAERWTPASQDRRRFPRLQVALPARMLFQSEYAKTFSCFCLVTNLSENGMYAKFLDSNSELDLRNHVSVYDLTLLEFRICLSRHTLIWMKGKMIHMEPGSKGIGVEFYEVPEVSKQKMLQFLRDCPDETVKGKNTAEQAGGGLCES